MAVNSKTPDSGNGLVILKMENVANKLSIIKIINGWAQQMETNFYLLKHKVCKKKILFKYYVITLPLFFSIYKLLNN